MFTTFDAPSGEVCVARREVSNTPLQALTLLNDPVFVEAAQALGRLLASRPGSVEDRIDYLVRRMPVPASRRLRRRRCWRSSSKHRNGASRARSWTRSVAGPGEGDAMERAAWTALARVLLNLDEAITRG